MNTELITLNPSLGNIQSYIHYAHRYPMLSKEEEFQLASRCASANDKEAAKELILAHLRFVISHARSYLGYGLPLSDLIQEGNIGLMKAVKRFDPSLGVRLSTYAMYWIKSEIQEFILRNWRIVKTATTKAQQKLFFSLRRMKKKIGWLSRSEVKSIADNLDVSTKDVMTMDERLHSADISYDSPIDDSQDKEFSPCQFLTDQSSNPALRIIEEDYVINARQRLVDAISTLDKRSQEIIYSRWLNPKKETLKSLAQKYKISIERVRQLEEAAFKKIKSILVT